MSPASDESSRRCHGVSMQVTGGWDFIMGSPHIRPDRSGSIMESR
jgi:hypothetical protein